MLERILEQLYTPKGIAVFTALILVANGLLLYQLWDNSSPARTASTPTTSDEIQIPDVLESDEGTEEPEEEAPDESGPDAEGTDGSAQGAPSQGETDGGPDEGGQVSGQEIVVPDSPGGGPVTPFNSQYDPPPVDPAPPGESVELADFDPGVSGGSEGSATGFAVVRTVVLSTLYETDEDLEEPGAQIGLLPATSGLGPLPALAFVAATLVAVLLILRRR